ncbi:uncharacterized protein CcaverHIS019_0104820 [Cutaneotrichosporon cavernicola]|uniref:Uncharacterized protein n=1 Tax=Cutaneotrichosporon cavernicola TaxID=279322 RepID=A0AA48I1D5_9TREE|nr:uncharacterized protein CcaverHIS019_0104820 [Cutaneotrichosporon cavernicola]BEI87764.1 hypothetical protein CcaverHIS019_0104820 [Cutaneotrichosporon cavernicola]
MAHSHTPSPPRRPQRSTLRLSTYHSGIDLDSPQTSTTSLPLHDSPAAQEALAALTAAPMMRSKSEADIFPTPNTPGTPGTPRTPGPQRPPTAHLRASKGRRKPVPSVLGSDFGSLSIDTSSHNSHGSAPRSPPPSHRSHAELVAFLDDGPLPLPQRPRGPSLSSLSAMSTLSAASQSRPYTLPVDPPLHRGLTPPPSPPGTPTPPTSHHRHNGSAHSHPTSATSYSSFFGGLPRYSTLELTAATDRSESRQPALAFGADPDMRERLPRYEAKPRTETITLAATLWQWGFFFFPFWFIGMFILWSPLEYQDNNLDPEKKQTVQEMLSITELKYARRCAIACAVVGAIAAIVTIVLCAVLIPK